MEIKENRKNIARNLMSTIVNDAVGYIYAMYFLNISVVLRIAKVS
jgi:hypothetical protein